MNVGIPKETVAGERRVALVPELVGKLIGAGLEVQVERDAGEAAGFANANYEERGAQIATSVFEQADIVLKVQPPTVDEIQVVKDGATLIGFLHPYTNRTGMEALARRGLTAFAMELMPRITRAQPMDALSAMSTISGYKAVLLAANRLPKLFPLLMTAAGTIRPARVFIIGAGVAGLQAIGTARRLGAVVEAYDTRPTVQEQVESLGAKFVDLGLPTADAEAATGYAKAQTEEFYQRQREGLANVLAAADVVITTALVPGQPAPVLITAEMVGKMRPGSVIVDLAAEQGGNCALTQPDAEVVEQGVTILGPMNLPSTVPYHASQMYAQTVTNYLLHLLKEGRLVIDRNDELTNGPLVVHAGEIVNPLGEQGA
ncbi:MAG: Re/Si-specific NAD(P)(+) transhydrogenase subunit alpha [Gemmataceae bacterium]